MPVDLNEPVKLHGDTMLTVYQVIHQYDFMKLFMLEMAKRVTLGTRDRSLPSILIMLT